ncbi:MAG: DsbA family oxidoreductase [Saprospiraceae bacterium]|nr:DsbA family oxidoreductase [Saprospiraceae bacterium]
MKIEIWSDVVCPWCYLGKRRLEHALERFEHKDEVDIVFKSFQLDPTMVTEPDLNISEYLAKRKGLPIDQARAMNVQMEELAAKEGLDYNLSNVIPLNTMQAHCVLHFAKSKGKQLQVKEGLMQAYFTGNLNLDDQAVLSKIAKDIGLNEKEVLRSLQNKQYVSAVQRDIEDGIKYGLSGVPYFVFNESVSVSGAQSEDVFLKTLKKAFQDWSN